MPATKPIRWCGVAFKSMLLIAAMLALSYPQWPPSEGRKLHSKLRHVPLRRQLPGDTESHLRDWQCTKEEDDELLALRAIHPHPWPETSGFLQFALGDSILSEAGLSGQCLIEAFGEEVPRTLVTPTWDDLGCTNPEQHGGPDGQACWARLMKMKAEAARRFPYDINLMIDTDVFANSGHPKRLLVLNSLRSQFYSSDADIMGVNEPISLANRADQAESMPFNWINGGFVAYRRSANVDRFFTCASRYIDENPGKNEQDAYNMLLSGWTDMPMRSVKLSVLSNSWSCRGLHIEPRPTITDPMPYSQDDPEVECLFVHSKDYSHEYLNQETCPLSPPPEEATA
mmetsp:Transcript_3416/g.8774  ORF Transcript_3416/g.8774 Transcript_3416/m.8774 type:complete len:342 (-) Transcript_3416:79-1104(-)